jgi:hypothetical protein
MDADHHVYCGTVRTNSQRRPFNRRQRHNPRRVERQFTNIPTCFTIHNSQIATKQPKSHSPFPIHGTSTIAESLNLLFPIRYTLLRLVGQLFNLAIKFINPSLKSTLHNQPIDKLCGLYLNLFPNLILFLAIFLFEFTFGIFIL